MHDMFLFHFVEKWTLLINQTHPKILGRLLMGIDAAKRILRRGEPFVLEVSWTPPAGTWPVFHVTPVL